MPLSPPARTLHPPLGRDGQPLGRQPHRRPDPRAAVPVRARDHRDEICETLNLARSNVSTSLRELQSWNLARVTHVLGDRRDHFETYKDVWDIFRAVVQERRRREIEPTLSMLRTAVLDGDNAAVSPDPTDPRDRLTLARMREVLEFMETGTGWIDEMNRLDPKPLIKLLKMGARIQQFVRGPIKPLPEPQAQAVGVLFADEDEAGEGAATGQADAGAAASRGDGSS